MTHSKTAPAGGASEDAGRSSSDAGRVGRCPSSTLAVGSHVRYELLQPAVGVLGQISGWRVNCVGNRQLHHRRLPISTEFSGWDLVRRNGCVSPDRESDTSPSRPADRSERAWLSALRDTVWSLRETAVGRVVHMLPAPHIAGERHSFCSNRTGNQHARE